MSERGGSVLEYYGEEGKLERRPPDLPLKPADEGAGGERRARPLGIERAPGGVTAAGVLRAVALGALTVAAVAAATIALLVLVTLWNVFGLAGRAGGGVGDRLGEAVARTGQTVAGAAQGIADAADPAHPPRAALPQDVEFDQIVRASVGGEALAPRDYKLTLTEIKKRADAANGDQAQYAVLHRELRQPKETQLLGRTVRVDKDEADYYLYKGQTFRVGRDLYKVNWVSLAAGQVGLARYRQPDSYYGPLVFELE